MPHGNNIVTTGAIGDVASGFRAPSVTSAVTAKLTVRGSVTRTRNEAAGACTARWVASKSRSKLPSPLGTESKAVPDPSMIEKLVQAIEALISAYDQSASPFVWRKREVQGSQLRTTIVNLRN